MCVKEGQRKDHWVFQAMVAFSSMDSLRLVVVVELFENQASEHLFVSTTGVILVYFATNPRFSV
jgi:hypothetical protein